MGDPKQSIYRFRRADIETYEKARERLIARGAKLEHRPELPDGPFHSLLGQPHLFTDLIQPSEEGPFQPSYVPLVPHPERKEVIKAQPGVILLAPPPDFDPREASARKGQGGEAQSIAALIEEMAGGEIRKAGG